MRRKAHKTLKIMWLMRVCASCSSFFCRIAAPNRHRAALVPGDENGAVAAPIGRQDGRLVSVEHVAPRLALHVLVEAVKRAVLGAADDGMGFGPDGEGRTEGSPNRCSSVCRVEDLNDLEFSGLLSI